MPACFNPCAKHSPPRPPPTITTLKDDLDMIETPLDKVLANVTLLGGGLGAAQPPQTVHFLVVCWRRSRQHTTKKEHEEGLCPSLPTPVSHRWGGAERPSAPPHLPNGKADCCQAKP